jgi:hypothetical protein
MARSSTSHLGRLAMYLLLASSFFSSMRGRYEAVRALSERRYTRICGLLALVPQSFSENRRSASG